MSDREVVECSHSPLCGITDADHHGWDCPLSDPAGDLLRVLDERGPYRDPDLEAERLRQLGRIPGETGTPPGN